jgi:hypothetical protein
LVPYDVPWSASVSLDGVGDTVTQPAENPGATGRVGLKPGVPGKFSAVLRYVPPYASALEYAGLGEREAMFDFLEQASAARDVHLICLPVDAKWDPFRTDPRFIDLLARCGFRSGL